MKEGRKPARRASLEVLEQLEKKKKKGPDAEKSSHQVPRRQVDYKFSFIVLKFGEVFRMKGGRNVV